MSDYHPWHRESSLQSWFWLPESPASPLAGLRLQCGWDRRKGHQDLDGGGNSSSCCEPCSTGAGRPSRDGPTDVSRSGPGCGYHRQGRMETSVLHSSSEAGTGGESMQTSPRAALLCAPSRSEQSWSYGPSSSQKRETKFSLVEHPQDARYCPYQILVNTATQADVLLWRRSTG